MNVIKCKSDIAIILGVYNAEQYISEQLDSIINQTFTNWSLYVRDDNSTDSTLDIVKRYAIKNDNIYIIEDKDGNLGCNGNYFRILSQVDSTYYMFCNADDFWLRDKIYYTFSFFKEVERLQAPDTPIIVHTDLKISDSSLNVICDSYWDSYNINPRLSNTSKFIGISNAVAGATMLFNRQVKSITYPVCGTRPFFDQWIAMKTLQAGGIIEPIYKSTIIYRQIGNNLAAVGNPNDRSLLNKIRNIRTVISINCNEAKILKSIKWCGYLKYCYLKMLFIIKSRFV